MPGSHAAEATTLKNVYWLLRHGRSLANEAGVIVSTLEEGVLPKWRLGDVGRQQALDAGQQLAQHLEGNGDQQPLLVVVSPFARTLETAELAAGKVGVGRESFEVEEALMERYFGSDNELKPYSGRYEAIWQEDVRDLDSRPCGDGESVNMVVKRLQGLFNRLESAHQGRNILLVSHGDTLTICQAAMTPNTTVDLHYHHRDCVFQTAQLKRLN